MQQAKDAGLALVLILLMVFHIVRQEIYLLSAIVVLVLVMAWPAIFRPWAKVWFGLSHLLGTVVSKVLLTVVFLVIATPVGVLMRLTGKDSMQLALWKQNRDSVFVKRDHLFTAEDVEKPF